MDEWLRGLFPRQQDLAELAVAVLDVLNERGYLPLRGWRSIIAFTGYSRSSYQTTMRRLVDHGLVETRYTQGSRDRFVGVYVRSERCLGVLGDLSTSMAEYRLRHSWWVPAGPVRIPAFRRAVAGRSGVRRQPWRHGPGRGHADTAERTGRAAGISRTRRGISDKEQCDESKPSRKRRPDTRGISAHGAETAHPTRSEEVVGQEADLFVRLGKALGLPAHRAKEMAGEWAEQMGLASAEEAARMYLQVPGTET